MRSNHLSTTLAGLRPAARSWHCQGGNVAPCGTGRGFNFPFTEETADIPSQICCWHHPSHVATAMPGADSAPGLDCHPNSERARGKAANVRILPVQSSAGCCARAACSWGKRKLCGEERGTRAGCAVQPTELFVITALKNTVLHGLGLQAFPIPVT